LAGFGLVIIEDWERETAISDTGSLFFWRNIGILLLCKDLGARLPIIIKNRKLQRKKCQQHFLRRCRATGNRQQATGNYTHNRLNRVNYLTALLKSPQIKVSHSIVKTPLNRWFAFRACGNTGFLYIVLTKGVKEK